MIEASNLVFDYPGRRALDGVSLSVAPGSITALVGPNGAGKTTLVRCLAGLHRPVSGRVLIAQVDALAQPRGAHRLLGYLSDFFGLYESMSVAAGLRFIAATRGVPEGELDQAVRRAAERVGLSERLDARAGALSRGMRQRLGIGQAIVHEPKVLLLDEPASGLDPEARLSLSDLLRALKSSGMTLLVSSHILAELEDYATHMVVLRSGRVMEQVALASHDNRATRWLVELAESSASAESDAAGVAGVRKVEPHQFGLVITFEGDHAARAVLVRNLVSAGLPVCGFSEYKKALEDHYLEAVRKRPSP